VSLTPPVRRTWAPVGHTPVLRTPFNWKRLSMAGAICYRPDRRGAAIVFQTRPGTYNDEAPIEFLGELHDFLGDAKVTLLWDGLGGHRSKRMQKFLIAHRRWLVVEPLPPYAPELNPVEALWGNLKGTDLANRHAETLDEIEDVAHCGIDRIASDAQLAFAFLGQSGLSL